MGRPVPGSKGARIDRKSLCVRRGMAGSTTKGILWGDSHATHFGPEIDFLASEANASIILTQPCPAIFDGARVNRLIPEDPTYNAKCGTQRSEVLRTLRENTDINLVILASAWAYLPATTYRNDPSIRNDVELFEQALDDTVSKIASAGRRVIIIGMVPEWPKSMVLCELASAPLLRRPCAPVSLSHAQALTFLRPTNAAILRSAHRHPNTIAIMPDLALCGSGSCLNKLNSELIYMDAGHIRLNLEEGTKRRLSKLLGLDLIFSR